MDDDEGIHKDKNKHVDWGKDQDEYKDKDAVRMRTWERKKNAEDEDDDNKEDNMMRQKRLRRRRNIISCDNVLQPVIMHFTLLKQSSCFCSCYEEMRRTKVNKENWKEQ